MSISSIYNEQDQPEIFTDRAGGNQTSSSLGNKGDECNYCNKMIGLEPEGYCDRLLHRTIV